MVTNKKATNAKYAAITGMSTWFTACRNILPTPGQVKTLSVTIANATTVPICRPAMVITGGKAFLSACLPYTSLSGRPRARELDMVGAHYFERFRAYQTHDESQLIQAERDGRQQQGLPALHSQQGSIPKAQINNPYAAVHRAPPHLMPTK